MYVPMFIRIMPTIKCKDLYENLHVDRVNTDRFLYIKQKFKT